MKNARDPRNYLYIDGKSILTLPATSYSPDLPFSITKETNIHAHRLFGPLPETATYLCHWEFDIGSVKGEIKPSFLMGTASYAQTFVYNLIDEDNAVSTDMAPVDYPDVTFLNARIREVDIYLTTQNSASLLQLQNGINVEFDNLTNEKYNQRVGIKLPVISFTCLANQDQSTQQQVMMAQGDRRYHPTHYSFLSRTTITLGRRLLGWNLDSMLRSSDTRRNGRSLERPNKTLYKLKIILLDGALLCTTMMLPQEVRG
jgi:hypothetical protein